VADAKKPIRDELYGDAVREKLVEFANRGWEAIPEAEREEWFTRLEFWGIFHQRSGQESYFMLGLTNYGGVLEPGPLRAIGEVARDDATGPVELAEPGHVSDDPCPFDAQQSCDPFDDGPTPVPTAPDGTPIPSGTCP
jgi:ferredoxin-nitrite reductase